MDEKILLRKKLQKRLEKTLTEDDEEILGEIDRMLLEEKELSLAQRLSLQSELYAAVRRLDVVEELLQMPGVNEIMINGYDRIYIEENGQLRRWEKSFVSRERLEDVIQQIVAGFMRRFRRWRWMALYSRSVVSRRNP